MSDPHTEINHVVQVFVAEITELARRAAVDTLESAVVADDRPAGVVAIAQEIHLPDLVEIEVNQVRRGIKVDVASGARLPRVGERVLVDPSLSYAIGTLGMPKSENADAPEVSVSWDDVGGLEDAKAQLREAIEVPFSHPELYRGYGKRPPHGVLLYGPPGTGKTLLAKAAATSIARAHGRDRMAAGGFLYVKGPELISKWIGESEAKIRALFAATREFRRAHGHPSVVFLDEADAMLGGRDRGPNVSINATTVPQFLAEMDGFDEPSAIFLLATNRPDILDPAVTREGRIDLKIKIDRPDAAAARQILRIHLRGRPLAPGRGDEATRADRMAKATAASVFEPGRWVVRSYPVPGRSEHARVELRHLVSGATLSQIVEQATTAAMRRDLAEDRRAPSGISAPDLEAAIEVARVAQRDLDHGDAIAQIVEEDQR